MDNPLHESPRHFNQNFNSEFFNRFVSLPLSELPGMSSSVKNEGPDTRLSRKDAIGSVVFRGPRCLVFVQLNPDHPGSPPFWNKVYKPQENVYDAHGPIFPASRGLSRRGKMKQEERDLCRLPKTCFMKPPTKFWSKLTGFQNRFCLMCNARALLDCTLTIIEPMVDNGFHEICEFRNFSAIKSSVSTLGDERIKK